MVEQYCAPDGTMRCMKCDIPFNHGEDYIVNGLVLKEDGSNAIHKDCIPQMVASLMCSYVNYEMEITERRRGNGAFDGFLESKRDGAGIIV